MGQKINMTPKDFFLHFGIVVTLYVSTIALISFLFAIVTLLFPVESTQSYVHANAQNTISWSSAIFLVVFPVLLYLLFKTGAYLRANTERASIAIRKWFIALTIFVTAATIIIDLIVLLTSFLGGDEMTVQFLLKVCIVIVVALVIFWLSLQDLKNQFVTNKKVLKVVAISTSTLAALLLIIGFVLVGSPQELRKQKQDSLRVQDLQFIQSEIVEHWKTTQQLPESLTVLNDILRFIEVPVDPQTQLPYEYEKVDETTFMLCATFETTSQHVFDSGVRYPRGYDIDYFFEHEAGHTCYTRAIDPERIIPYDIPQTR